MVGHYQSDNICQLIETKQKGSKISTRNSTGMEEDMVDKDRDDPLQAATAASKPANTGKFEFSIAPLQ
ncbi:unnamed protein product [Brugia timori]|uniref:Uncharacterized protein n=1 Tax=Brugia timori TaxID=42155 RepID=A0A0R3R969_9BILA|nr:unnamed protein product [Brugia timori]